MSFELRVDLTNPGQFFACCGLFELAGRLDRAALAHFQGERFAIEGAPSLADTLRAFTAAPFTHLDPNDGTASPLRLGGEFDLLLDWWKDQATGGRDLKVWAGTMQSTRIAQAMTAALRPPELWTADLFDVGQVVYDPIEVTKKVEPFYFDARRAPNAHSRDVGFSPNDLDLTTTAFPAVEALCFIGLQRFRPRPHPLRRRVFDYSAWPTPLPLALAPAVASGCAGVPGVRRYRFEAWFRTGQKKHKAFRAAVPVNEGART